MSMIEVTSDVKNPLLSRREISCTFKGLAGRLKKLEAAEMISEQFSLGGKIVIPILLKNETGKPQVFGTFYVYEDEKLARQHLKTAIFNRLEKAKGTPAKPEGGTSPPESKAEEKPKEDIKAEEKPKKEEKKVEEKKEETK